MAPALYIVPVPLSTKAGAVSNCISTGVLKIVHSLRHFLVENAKSSRACLKAFEHPGPISELSIVELQDHRDEVWTWLSDGHSVGVMSEAGYPCTADPGEEVVLQAHNRGFEVIPLVGPSSLIMALAASGLGGERFTFHGYLPRTGPELQRSLKKIERSSRQEGTSEIFIETPYRTPWLMQQLVENLHESTTLCIASELTTPDQIVMTKSIGAWRDSVPKELKRNTVFIIVAPSLRRKST